MPSVEIEAPSGALGLREKMSVFGGILGSVALAWKVSGVSPLIVRSLMGASEGAG